MKSLDEIKKYYAKELVPELSTLEEQRLQVRNKALIWIAIIIPVSIGLTFLFKHPAMIILGIFGCAGVVYLLSREYVKNFKVGIIEKIVRSIDDNLSYLRTSYIPRSTFTKSQLFKHRIDRYRGDDYVCGMLGKTKVEFSEIHAEYITRDSKGRTRHHTIFKGLFFVADFNKAFKGTTIVLPDVAERLFAGLGTMFQSWNKGRGQLIKLEDPEFEKMFVVYGNDQIEPRYILSTSLMRRIVEFKKKKKRKIHLSFIGSKIFVAISYTRNLFEPRIFRTLLDFAPIQQYYGDLKTATDVVEELNLNTRIWSKT